MQPSSFACTIRPQPGTHLRLDRPTRFLAAQPLTLAAISGRSWVTIDGDPRDVVLESGDRLAVPVGAAVVVTPLHRDDSFELMLVMPPAVAAVERAAEFGHATAQRMLRLLQAAARLLHGRPGALS